MEKGKDNVDRAIMSKMKRLIKLKYSCIKKLRENSGSNPSYQSICFANLDNAKFTPSRYRRHSLS